MLETFGQVLAFPRSSGRVPDRSRVSRRPAFSQPDSPDSPNGLAPKDRAWLTEIAIAFGFIIIYSVVGQLSLRLAFLNPSASPVWPPTGIALAALILFGLRIAPAVFIGALVVNVPITGLSAATLMIAAGNTLEAVLGAWLVRRYAHGANAFFRLGDFLKYVLCGGLLCTAVSSTIDVASLCLDGFAHWGDFASIWRTWWLGDLGGAMVVAPPLILWVRHRYTGWSGSQMIEAALTLCVMVAVDDLVFVGHILPGLSRYPLAFLCFLPLQWAAYRFGPRETATGGLVLLGIATAGVLRNASAYSIYGPHGALLLMQTFMIVSMTTVMAMAAVFSERRRARTELELQAAELRRSNADLEQFAAVIGHDLKDPLSFVQFLARQDNVVDPRANTILRSVRRATARMWETIDALLESARAGTGISTEPVDSGMILDRALENLPLGLRESRAVITRDRLPTVTVDAALLTHVFQNLIGNAIKFRGSGPPRIHVSAERNVDEWIFSVSDNGIGVAPENVERIFEMYERGGSTPGSGIGLAICKRIVERHGGRIWVDSTPSAGSTVHFTVPVREDDDVSRPGSGTFGRTPDDESGPGPLERHQPALRDGDEPLPRLVPGSRHSWDQTKNDNPIS